MPTSMDQLQERYGQRYKWWVMITVMIGTMTMSLSSTIVNVALPDIMQTFSVSHTMGQWLVTAFLASMAIGMLLNVWMVDRFGPRTTYMGALVVFVAAAVAGGLAMNFGMLIVVRILQGLIAGMVQPLAMLMLYAVFPVHQRGQAMGLYAMGVVLGPTVGPVVGGVLVDWWSWRSVFLVVLPFCIAAFWLGSTFLSRPASAPPVHRRLDGIGLLLLTGWMVALLWGLSEGPHLGWGSLPVIVGLAAAAVLFAGFTVHQLRSRSPLLALRIFRHSGFTPAFLVAILTGAGLFGSVYLLPMLVQTAMGESASAAGMLLMPAGLAMALSFPVIGRLTDRVLPKILVAGGLVLFAISSIVLSEARVDMSLTLIALMAALGRVGLAMTMPPVVIGAVSIVPQDMINQATGLISFARQFGGSLGVSLSAILLQENTLWTASFGVPEAFPGYQDAFALMALFYLIGLYPMARMQSPPAEERKRPHPA
ncbi:DHA2 family efflux MFS transporter permease subunit [Marinobacter bryozoorum]|uniref:DHA2 family efflux MFS transporter permease subunit n=1 Tax=Marinobacter bryozoorum TaxID=256324 RepID=UPI00200416AA|nr:DHA2 family efflux MFS transporter permease subunit [Marinobacter bryozoorum]MCK7545004.1 DHA2 family efflux MFS transporter permease subunit [Marinobacter bryozoorum]